MHVRKSIGLFIQSDALVGLTDFGIPQCCMPDLILPVSLSISETKIKVNPNANQVSDHMNKPCKLFCSVTHCIQVTL